MSPDVIAAGVFGVVGAVAGALVGLFGERLVRRIGDVRCEVDDWWIQQGDTGILDNSTQGKLLAIDSNGFDTSPSPLYLQSVDT